MKFKRSTLFSILLLPLMLTSCGGNTPTTTPSNPGSGSTTEKPTPDSTKPTDKDSTTSSPTGTTEDSGDVDPSETQWNEEIIQLMQEHLGGNVIPDVYIGKSNQIEGKYVEDDKEDDYLSSVVLTGDTFVASNLKDAIETYKKYGYEVVFAHNVFTAVNEKNHLTVIEFLLLMIICLNCALIMMNHSILHLSQSGMMMSRKLCLSISDNLAQLFPLHI